MLQRMLFVLLILFSSAVAAADDLNMIITLGKDDLQRRIDRMFPITQQQAMLHLKLSQPAVLLKEGSDRIGLRLRLDATVGQDLKVTGSAAVDGKLRFVSQRSAFYLDEPQIKEITIEGLPPVYQELLRQGAQVGVQELLAQQPVYVLGQMGESKRILGSELKGVTVEGGQLLLELAMP